MIKKNTYEISKLINLCNKKFKKQKLHYGQSTNNSLTEAIYLIFAKLNLNIYKIQKNIKKKINKKKFKIIHHLMMIRIKKKIPIAYLTKKVWFCKKKFYINYGAIIPRSPIAKLINNKFKIINNLKPKKILDLCTGSACIAICCSYIFPKAIIDAVDISNKALKIAKKNIIIHNMENKINLIKSNLFNKLKNKKYDLIISNPPYVNVKDLNKLPKEYSYEPKIAFISPDKGCYHIQNIINQYNKFLNYKGYLICETGYQKKKIKKNNPNIKFKWIKFNNKENNIFLLKKK